MGKATKVKSVTLMPSFVQFIPEHRDLKEGILYVSMQYGVVVHFCPCGCGHLSELTLDQDRWMLSYNGVSLSLTPSIGNSRLPCRSHYWIKDNKVIWCERMTKSAASMKDAAETRARELTHGIKPSFLRRLADRLLMRS